MRLNIKISYKQRKIGQGHKIYSVLQIIYYIHREFDIQSYEICMLMLFMNKN